MEAIDKSYHIQGSAEWFQERLGKFTSSEMHKLLVEPRSKTPGEVFGDGAKTYIFQKLNELVTGQVTNIDLSYKDAIAWGHAHEPDAVIMYSQRTGNPVSDCGFEVPVDLNYIEMCGGSPDGLIYKKGIIEVKCPYNGENHMVNLRLKDEAEFAKKYPKYYAQIQTNLWVTGTEFCDFISFDPRPTAIFNQIKVLRIEPNNSFIDEIKMKIDLGFNKLISHFENIIISGEGFDTYMQSLKVAA